jgi:hypothetical protein
MNLVIQTSSNIYIYIEHEFGLYKSPIEIKIIPKCMPYLNSIS